MLAAADVLLSFSTSGKKCQVGGKVGSGTEVYQGEAGEHMGQKKGEEAGSEDEVNGGFGLQVAGG